MPGALLSAWRTLIYLILPIALWGVLPACRRFIACALICMLYPWHYFTLDQSDPYFISQPWTAENYDVIMAAQWLHLPVRTICCKMTLHGIQNTDPHSSRGGHWKSLFSCLCLNTESDPLFWGSFAPSCFLLGQRLQPAGAFGRMQINRITLRRWGWGEKG